MVAFFDLFLNSFFFHVENEVEKVRQCWPVAEVTLRHVVFRAAAPKTPSERMWGKTGGSS